MKRDATAAELESELAACERTYPQTRQKHDAAVAEGYKAETCLLDVNGKQCGVVYLAHHHMTDCREQNCPFHDGNGTLFEVWKRQLETVAESG